MNSTDSTPPEALQQLPALERNTPRTPLTAANFMQLRQMAAVV